MKINLKGTILARMEITKRFQFNFMVREDWTYFFIVDKIDAKSIGLK